MSRKNGIHWSKKDKVRILKDVAHCDDDAAMEIANVIDSFTFNRLDDLYRAIWGIRKGEPKGCPGSCEDCEYLNTAYCPS